MKISIENSLILICDLKVLKKYHISQLEYYGFSWLNTCLQKMSFNVDSDLVKVLNYLKNENIPYTMSEEDSKKLENISESKNELNETFKIASRIKDGDINHELFNEFVKFIKKLPRKLKEHQIKASYHFYVLKNGANFSVPGSGKTSVVLSVYEKLRIEGKCNIIFIIGPPSCFQPWKNEFIDTLGRPPKSVILSGAAKSIRTSEYHRSDGDLNELYLCTFHTALKDYLDIIHFFSRKNIKAFLVLDEAHYIKQVGGSWASTILKISPFATYRGVLTGTPVPKSYKDLFNIFEFLWGINSPLTEEDKAKIELWEKAKKDDNVRELLREKIDPLFYRVRKKDLNLTPPVFHTPIIVKMNKYEQEIYNYINSKIVNLSKDDYTNNEPLLSKLWAGRMIRLRQALSYPKLLLSAVDDYSERLVSDTTLKSKIKNYDLVEVPAKLEKLLQLVASLRTKRQKVLIWSNFISTLHLIKSHITLSGEKCEIIYGKTPIRKNDIIGVQEEKTREDIRDEFIDPNSGLDILIANPAACAESISLHKTCFHAIYYDLSYNCAQYIQSLDRIHRVGGSESNEANYYFIQYENSLDQDIKRNLEIKIQKMYEIIEQNYQIYDLDLSDSSLEDDIDAYKRLFHSK